MNLDKMLYEDMRFLVKFAKEKNYSTFQFLDMASSFDLRQEDWSKFWKDLRKE